ncbi:hypothetical protein F0919_13805 [Taibaiella lutea]|uniref:Glycosyltransferase RgtA/B/C/D-like domain-containing protein n=1 Tax=Taibaiella lutea TaxID=2608001 RepID=A0A5M6CKF1_9BACT|nr:hypothetical protein [Taibaiella lutea]KAA5533609.1 hypothetical protein F0919_13805 [Taibaiella lutea]
MDSNKKFYQRPIFWIIFFFVYAIIASRYVKIDIHDPGFGRSWYFGDSSSEGNVESAAKFYMEKGFRPNAGLPTYNHLDTIPDNDYVYTHYPPMAEWIAGVTAQITHNYKDHCTSVLPLLLSVVLFFMIFYILARWLNNDIAAFIGASVLVLSNYFISWADDTHQHLYIEFFRWSFVYLWWWYLTIHNKKYIIPILAICSAMMCLLSFEPYIYILIIIIGFPLALRQKILRWEVIVLLLVPAFSFSLRLYLNAEYFGGFTAMLHDMKGAFLNRTGASADVSELQRTMHFSDYVYLLPKTRLHRLGHFYIFPSLVIILFGILGLIQLKKHFPSFYRIAVVIYIASVSWAFVMPQHALIHIFTLRHIGIFIGIVIGFGLIKYKEILVLHWKSKNYLLLSGHVIILGYSVFYIAINTVYFVYLKYGLLYPHLGTDNFELFDYFLM